MRPYSRREIMAVVSFIIFFLFWRLLSFNHEPLAERNAYHFALYTLDIVFIYGSIVPLMPLFFVGPFRNSEWQAMAMMKYRSRRQWYWHVVASLTKTVSVFIAAFIIVIVLQALAGMDFTNEWGNVEFYSSSELPQLSPIVAVASAWGLLLLYILLFTLYYFVLTLFSQKLVIVVCVFLLPQCVSYALYLAEMTTPRIYHLVVYVYAFHMTGEAVAIRIGYFLSLIACVIAIGWWKVNAFERREEA